MIDSIDVAVVGEVSRGDLNSISLDVLEFGNAIAVTGSVVVPKKLTWIIVDIADLRGDPEKIER